MAKTVFVVDHECGHTQEHDLSKKPAGKRAGLAAWLKDKPCWDCGKSSGISPEQKAEQEAQTAETEKTLGLPDLAATPAQTPKLLPWGRQIRAAVLREAYDLVESGKETESWFTNNFLEPAKRITGCTWWVDNREATLAEMPELLDDSGEGSPFTWVESKSS
jgi:hypothetical protein